MATRQCTTGSSRKVIIVCCDVRSSLHAEFVAIVCCGAAGSDASSQAPASAILLRSMQELAAEVQDMETELCLEAASGADHTQANILELREQRDTLIAIRQVTELQLAETQGPRAQSTSGVHVRMLCAALPALMLRLTNSTN